MRSQGGGSVQALKAIGLSPIDPCLSPVALALHTSWSGVVTLRVAPQPCRMGMSAIPPKLLFSAGVEGPSASCTLRSLQLLMSRWC
ncbi:unnamed protein product [Knipowitschia caucasica]|uniref:Uncharacterized protein n=1 Tax=Knipowitschia caucasica TaxID=637954 RepID=A0AAV2LRZ5_KNICA